jgi:hypothetical protein
LRRHSAVDVLDEGLFHGVAFFLSMVP